MGMSASQARLLSITSRLTNNEFRSQTITNSKLRLATESQKASQDYMDALNSQQLMFMNYDDNGLASKVELTPAVLYDYAPMKNQYMIANSVGKYIVSSVDAQNFEDSKDLFEFLKKYDLSYDTTNAANDKIKEAWQAKRDKDYADYLNELEAYNKEKDIWDEWNKNGGKTAVDTSLYDKFVSIVGTSQNPKLWCYKNGIKDNNGPCYLHLLNHLLDYDGEYYACTEKNNIDYIDTMPDGNQTYYTTLNYSFNPKGLSGKMGDQILKDEPAERNNLKLLSDAIKDDNNKCDGADKFTPYYNNDGKNDRLEWTNGEIGEKDNLNLIQQAINEGRVPTNYEQLKSDYKYDTSDPANPKAVIKTLKEKLCDLYFLILCSDIMGLKTNREQGDGTDKWSDTGLDASLYGLNSEDIQRDLKEMIINFTEGDLKQVSVLEDTPEPPVREKPIWHEPPEPEYLEGVTILRDQEKSQWYTNLWHAMNGSETSNTVDPINFDNDVDYINKIPDDIRSEYRFIVENKTKNTKTTNYEILDSNLNNSAEWLQFALEHGAVSLVQAQYYNPDEDSNKTANMSADGFKWNNIVYTSARDIVQQDNQKAIAMAEVKYKKRITEIENQDTKFDQDLKKLDTEHSALQTEYESIKEVLSKNVDRSFKAFS